LNAHRGGTTRHDPSITITSVRGWLAEAAPRWPALDDKQLTLIAQACEDERRQQLALSVKRRDHNDDLLNFHAAIKQARLGANAVLDALPTLMKAVGNTLTRSVREAENDLSAQDDLLNLAREAFETLWNTKRALGRLLPYLAPIRRRGGQPKPWTAFAQRIANHLRLTREMAGTRTSLKENGPLVRVLEKAVGAVFGQHVSASAIANALQHREERQRKPVADRPAHKRG
jgi:hypothetical protein